MGLKICCLELVLGMQGIEKGTFSQTDLLLGCWFFFAFSWFLAQSAAILD